VHQSLHFEVREVKVVRVGLFRHFYLELGIVNEVINFTKIALVVNFFAFEDEFEELEVEDCFVGVAVLVEQLDCSILVDQVVIEEGRVLLRFLEDALGRSSLITDIVLQLAVFSLISL
jgi:hypothetical protein